MDTKILYAAGGIVASVLLLRACRSESSVAVVQPAESVAVQSPPEQPRLLFFGVDGWASDEWGAHHTTVVHHYTPPARRYYSSRRSYSRPHVFRTCRR